MTDKYLYSINGIISRTVASNNLTVAIKNFDGTDFSAGSPLVHKIGNTPRTLTGALSVTVAAGVSTFNAGSTELAAKEVDYFTYLGWRASDSSVFILISRIPYATTYADFHATATNEKYGAYSGAAPASTDPVTNIGRFNATNSGTASYNWSVPATSVVINYPIYETRTLNWTPSITYAGGSTDPTSNTVNTANYLVDGRKVFFSIKSTIVRGAGDRPNTIYTLPLSIGSTQVPGNGIDTITAGGLLVATIVYLLNATIIYGKTMSADGSMFPDGWGFW